MSKLLKTLMTSLKWWVAGEEMEELRCYKQAIYMAKQGMVEFPDAIDALSYIEFSTYPLRHQELGRRLRIMQERRQRILEGLCTFRTKA